MDVLRSIRRRLQERLIMGVCLAAMIFFAHSALFDPHGLRRLVRLDAMLSQREAVLAEQRAVREAKEQQVRMLSPESLDPDLLDERARAALGLARPDEIVIFKQR
jgi:cell division protein FtsB